MKTKYAFLVVMLFALASVGCTSEKPAPADNDHGHSHADGDHDHSHDEATSKPNGK